MLAQILKRWYAARESYWFIPTVMAVLAAVLASILGWVDMWLGDGWTEEVDWFSGNHPDGARTMLSTIAGSMITVAGVTFSVTIASVAYTTSQFGPRLLTNFMRDQGNQITLGTFIATFVYCMFVLRDVRSAGEGFVPQISVLGALSLAIASIAVLIYFIHHVTESIHISNVTAGIGRDLEKALARRGEQEEDEGGGDLPGDLMAQAGAIVASPGNGYIQHLVESQLVELACDSNLIIKLERQPGDFVHYGETLARVWPAAAAEDELLTRMARAYALGRSRTMAEDLLFLVDELVEIAARALSPGVNDPFTAMGCLDWLRIALVRFSSMPAPNPYARDDEGEIRVIRQTLEFDALCDSIFSRLRPYFCSDPSAACHIINALARIAPSVDASRRPQLIRHNVRLHEAAMSLISTQPDRDRVTKTYKSTRAALEEGARA